MGSVSEPVTYALRFRGEAVDLGSGRYWSECSAPAGLFVRAIGPDGVGSRFGGFGGGQAICRRELELHQDGSFVSAGEISFGAGDAVTFRATGRFADDPEPGLRHGAAICEVTGGHGRLAGATGSIASQLLLAASGELTDHQLGLLFVQVNDR